MPHNRRAFVWLNFITSAWVSIFWVLAVLAIVIVTAALAAELKIHPLLKLSFGLPVGVLLWRIYFRFQLSYDSARDWWNVYKNLTR